MNEAWGAVVAGLAGALGASLGAWVTARAMIQQVAAQGREQQRNWLLDQRQAAYTELLTAYDSVRGHLHELVILQAAPDFWDDESRPSEQDRSRAWGALYESRDGLARRMRRIDIVGPSETMRPAMHAMSEAVEAVVNARLRYNSDPPEDIDPEWGAAAAAFGAAEFNFTATANAVLHSSKL